MVKLSDLRNRPTLLRVGIIIAGLEALGLVLFGIWNLVAILLAAREVHNSSFVPMGIGFLVVSLLLALFVAWGARGLTQGKRYGRAPVITWQIMQIVVALSTINVYPIVLNLLVIILSVFVIYAVLHKESLAATTQTNNPL